MIPAIKAYFDERVKEVDPDLSAYEFDVFGNNDITTNQAQKKYNLIIGITNTVRLNQGFTDEVDVTLDLWSSNGADVYQDYQDLYCKALDIRNGCINQLNIENAGNDIGEVESISTTPLEEDTNDNVFKMRLNFTVRRYFRVC